eukprot:297162_1
MKVPYLQRKTYKKSLHISLYTLYISDHDEKSEIEFQFALSNGTDYSNNAPTTDFAKNPFYESKKLACNEPIVSYRGEPFVDHDYTKPDNTYQTLPVFSFYPQRDPTIYCSGCHEYFGQKFAKIQCLRCNQNYCPMCIRNGVVCAPCIDKASACKTPFRNDPVSFHSEYTAIKTVHFVDKHSVLYSVPHYRYGGKWTESEYNAILGKRTAQEFYQWDDQSGIVRSKVFHLSGTNHVGTNRSKSIQYIPFKLADQPRATLFVVKDLFTSNIFDTYIRRWHDARSVFMNILIQRVSTSPK